MAANALMEKVGQGQMFVPPSKVQQFIQDGWRVIQPADEPLSMKPVPVAVETEPAAPEAPVVVDEKPKGRKSKK